MPVELKHIRTILEPGMKALANSFAFQKEIFAANLFNAMIEEGVVPVAEEVVPVSLPTALAMGAAVTLIKNPVVSRRFWKA